MKLYVNMTNVNDACSECIILTSKTMFITAVMTESLQEITRFIWWM